MAVRDTPRGRVLGARSRRSTDASPPGAGSSPRKAGGSAGNHRSVTSAPEVTIRRGEPEDLQAIGRLGAQLVRLHHDLDAKRFIDATLAELKSRGARQVVLSTAERNEAAQRLFTRDGFRRTMIEMTRELPDSD